MFLPMRLVHALQQSPLSLNQRGRQLLARLQVQKRQAFRSEASSLINRRQPTGLPVLNAVDRETLRIIQNNVCGEILVFAP